MLNISIYIDRDVKIPRSRKRYDYSKLSPKETDSNFLKNVRKNAENFVKNRVSLGEQTARIMNNSKEYAKNVKTRTTPIVNELRTKSIDTFAKTVEKSKKLDKNKLSNVLGKISTGFLDGLERIVGRVSIGSQYGNKSLRLLEELAKLKELGIITDEEYNQKKKEILSRI